MKNCELSIVEAKTRISIERIKDVISAFYSQTLSTFNLNFCGKQFIREHKRAEKAIRFQSEKA